MKKIKGLLILLLSVILNISIVNADTKNITVEDISIKDKSGTISVVDPVLESNEITSNITFNKVDDFVTYELTLKNNESDKYKIVSIKDNNTNNNLNIEYSYSKDFINKNETSKVTIKLTYKNKLVNAEKINLNNLSITITLENEDGKQEETIINPITGDNILKFLLLLIIAITGLIFVRRKVKYKGFKLGSFLILISIIILPFSILASEKYEIKLKFTDIVIKGEFEKLNVTFNLNNGEEPVIKEVTYNEKIGTLPPSPSKDGYTFDKWLDEDEIEVTEDTIITKNMTVNATYNIIKYTITFDSNGGSIIEDKIINYGDSLGELEEPVNGDKRFLGWYTNLTDGIKVDENYIPESDLTLYAKYKDLICKKATEIHTATCSNSGSCYKVGYKDGGEKGITTITFGTIPHANLTAGNAYDCDVNGDGTYDSDKERFYYLRTKGDNAVLISNYNYEGEAGQIIDNNYVYSEAITLLPTKDDWVNVEVTFNNRLDSSDTTTYAARFINFDDLEAATGKSDFSAVGSLDDYTYLQENTRFISNNIGRSGIWLEHVVEDGVNKLYRIHFGGTERFVIDVENSSKNVARPVIEVPMNYMETTDDSAITYTITFETNGGTEISPIEIEETDSIKAFPVTARKGYNFIGWYYDEELTNEVSESDTFTEDTTIYAKWEVVAAVSVNGTQYNSITTALADTTSGVETTIVLLKDIEENITISNNKIIILDLNDFTLKNKSNATVINNYGNLKVINGNVTTNSSSNGAVNNNVTGTLELVDVTVTSTGGKQALYNKGGTVTITGNSYLSNTANNRAAVHNLENGTMNIKSGTIVATGYHAVYNESGILNIGEKDGTIDNSTPVFEGENSGLSVANNQSFNFYDGIIKGKTNAIDQPSLLDDKEDGASLLTGTDGEYKTAYME